MSTLRGILIGCGLLSLACAGVATQTASSSARSDAEEAPVLDRLARSFRPSPARPALDQRAPAEVATATFGLG